MLHMPRLHSCHAICKVLQRSDNQSLDNAKWNGHRIWIKCDIETVSEICPKYRSCRIRTKWIGNDNDSIEMAKEAEKIKKSNNIHCKSNVLITALGNILDVINVPKGDEVLKKCRLKYIEDGFSLHFKSASMKIMLMKNVMITVYIMITMIQTLIIYSETIWRSLKVYIGWNFPEFKITEKDFKVFHWSLFLWVQLTYQQWFEYRFGQYLNQWWLSLLTHKCGTIALKPLWW